VTEEDKKSLAFTDAEMGGISDGTLMDRIASEVIAREDLKKAELPWSEPSHTLNAATNIGTQISSAGLSAAPESRKDGMSKPISLPGFSVSREKTGEP
jgi:hypothetical protein